MQSLSLLFVAELAVTSSATKSVHSLFATFPSLCIEIWCYSVDEKDLKLKKRLAAGAEGEVWLGTKAGHEGPVVIKVAHFADDPDEQPAWREAEVVSLNSCESELVTY